MLKTFLLGFDTDKVNFDEVASIIDNIPEIENWLLFLPGMFLIVTSEKPISIRKKIQNRWEKQFNFIIVGTDSRSGWLKKSAIDLLKNPKSVDDE